MVQVKLSGVNQKDEFVRRVKEAANSKFYSIFFKFEAAFITMTGYWPCFQTNIG